MSKDTKFIRRRSHNGTKLENFGEENKEKHPYRQQKTALADLRVSVCTDCKKGIFEFHEYSWTSRGLIHNWCKTDEDKNAEAALPK